jgi:hypothetical protein
MLGFGTGTVAAQTVHIDAYGVAVTDRRSGQVEEGAARGFGGGGRVTGTLGAFAAEVNVYAARLSVEPSSSRRDLLQLEVRGQLRVFPVLSLELSAVHRSMTPDVEGTEFGFVSAGAHADISVSTWGRFWGRLALIPLASFSGGGDAGFGAETGLGLDVALVGQRVHAVAQYGFQRIDRRIDQPPGTDDVVSVPVEQDVFHVGISVRFGHGPSAAGGEE